VRSVQQNLALQLHIANINVIYFATRADIQQLNRQRKKNTGLSVTQNPGLWMLHDNVTQNSAGQDDVGIFSERTVHPG